MLNVGKIIKKSLCFVMLIACATTVHAAVEKPNLVPSLALGGAGFALYLAGLMASPWNLETLLEEKAIDAWIEKNNLNQYGEPKNTIYQDAVNGPLVNQSRYQYIKSKFIDEDIKPWRSGFVRLIDIAKNLQARSIGMMISGTVAMVISLLIASVLDSKYEHACFKERLLSAIAASDTPALN